MPSPHLGAQAGFLRAKADTDAALGEPAAPQPRQQERVACPHPLASTLLPEIPSLQFLPNHGCTQGWRQ